MSRLPHLTHASADDAQRALWDQIVASRGDALDLVNADGSLAGPFGAFVARPEIGEHLIQVGAVVRFASKLTDRLKEIAISAVGARWKSEFEFWAHSQLALQAGVEQSIIDALAAGDAPDFADSADQAVYDYAVALAGNGRVPQQTYDAAIAAVGPEGVVDLTHTIGYYSHISFILNAFEVPLPDGVEPRWADS